MVHATALYPLVPSGANVLRATDFFVALGFEKQWENGGLAAFRFGGAFFLLQDINVPEWQKNQMITFEVEDLDVYWSEIEAKTYGRGLFNGEFNCIDVTVKDKTASLRAMVGASSRSATIRFQTPNQQENPLLRGLS